MSFLGGLLKQKNSATDDVKSRRHRPDYQIVLFMGLLMLLGLIIIYAIGPQRANVLNNAYGSNYSDNYFFIKQIVSLAVSLFAFFMMSIIPASFFMKNSGKILIFGFFLCLVLAIAGWLNLGIAQKTLGATRWFNLGFLGTLQPAELLKFSVLIYVASFLGIKIKKGEQDNLGGTLFPIGAVVAIALLFIVVIQKDLGTGISVIGIVLSMLIVSGLRVKTILSTILVLACLGVLLIVTSPHRIERVMTFFQGDTTSTSESSDDNYHIEHAKIAIGTGGLFGVGIGNSVQATGYLPEAINDSVFAIMGETFGFVGLVTILSLFTALLMRLLKVSDHLLDERYRLLVCGVFGWLAAHVILNVASMIGVAPLTGITLPLLSFGGTSMIIITGVLGLAFQLSRQTVLTSKIKETDHENIDGRRGVGRTRHSSRGSYTRN